jgi:prevent-host-death family protein
MRKKGGFMRSVNIAELKNGLCKYLTFVKQGEEIVIRDRSLPVAKIVPLSAEEATQEELLLVAGGKMRLPRRSVKIRELLRIPTGSLPGSEGIQALLDERAEGI